MSDTPPAPKAVWEADTTHPVEAEAIRTALRQVVDPELGLSIIELGLVRDLKIDPEQVHVKMILTTPFCPYGPAMMEMTRSKAAEASGGKPVVTELAMEMWGPSMMEEGAGAAWGL
jgi:metal-sulfur cluster biosynthetic enzyme